jgi:hypothetical protein
MTRVRLRGEAGSQFITCLPSQAPYASHLINPGAYCCCCCTPGVAYEGGGGVERGAPTCPPRAITVPGREIMASRRAASTWARHTMRSTHMHTNKTMDESLKSMQRHTMPGPHSILPPCSGCPLIHTPSHLSRQADLLLPLTPKLVSEGAHLAAKVACLLRSYEVHRGVLGVTRG